MNLDELTKNIRKVSDEDIVQSLAEIIQEWKTNQSNVFELRENVEQFLKSMLIEKRKEFDTVYKMWTEFRSSAIDGIAGMTMNERLYLFGLLKLFDKAKNDSDQEKYYVKLMTKR